jgi:hypothetical protein
MGTIDLPQPTDPQREWERALLAGLVGPHRDRYLNSPSFHAAIDRLRALLPAMIAGLAADADVADDLARELTHRLVAGEVNIDDFLTELQPDPPTG